MKLVYCIVVTYNGSKWADKCFSSLREADYPIKTIVIDNGSTDGTQDAIHGKFPEVDLIQSDINLGFGKANNLGIERALTQGADYIFLLNQDAYLKKGSFKSIINYLEEDNSIGVISPVHFAGDEQNLDLNFSSYLSPLNTPQILGDMLSGTTKKVYSSKFINAAAWIIRRSLLKEIGIFHPAFDHYAEDEEFIYRLHKSNYRLAVFTELFIVHDRPQNGNIGGRLNMSSSRFKQNMLLKFYTNKCGIYEITVEYFKTLCINVLSGKLTKVKENFICWLEIINTTNKYNDTSSNKN